MKSRSFILPVLVSFSLFVVSCGNDDGAAENAAATQADVRIGTMPVSAPSAMHSVDIGGRSLWLPEGLNIDRWVSGRRGLRMMALTNDGYLLVTEKDAGNVLAFNLAQDSPPPITAIQGLSTPSGIAFRDGSVWLAEEASVSRYDYTGQGQAGNRQIVIPGIPTGGHSTRTIGFGPDGKLYVAVGSSCNVCEEEDETRAAITRYNADGSGREIFARGLRNTVGFVWHPRTGQMWGVDNGRDLIGDDLPPEEVNVLEAGKHYGWPYCFGNQVVDPFGQETGRADMCPSTQPPRIQMQAHSAPLGLRFLDDPAWPDAFQGDLFISFHGSWNRTVPTGYKVVRAEEDGTVSDFITGWADATGNVWGRPVDIIVNNGIMYISDDHSGSIYRVRVADGVQP